MVLGGKKVSCKFQKYGCKEKKKDSQIEEHEVSCPYKFVDINAQLLQENEKFKGSEDIIKKLQEENKILQSQLEIEKESNLTKTKRKRAEKTLISSYRHGLWDKYSEIVEKLKLANSNLLALKNYIKAQGDAIEKLGLQMNSATIHINYYGELSSSFYQLQSFTNKIGQRNYSIAMIMINSMVKDLGDLSTELLKILKNSQNEEKRYKKEFETACNDCILIKGDDVKNKQQINTETGEEIKKPTGLTKTKWIKAVTAVNKSETNYQVAVLQQQYFHNKYFTFLDLELERLEQIDRKRVATIKEMLLRYTELLENLNALSVKKINDLKEKVEAIDDNSEIQNYILSVKSGNTPPDAYKFEPYQVEIPKDLSTTRFSVVAESKGMTKHDSVLSIKKESDVKTEVKSEEKTPQVEGEKEKSEKEGGGEEEEVGEIDESVFQKVITTVTALYDFNASGEGEISLKEGDKVMVYQMEDDWWIGECNGNRGYFPSNFVTQEK